MSKSLSFIKRKNSCGSRRISALLLAMLAFVCTVVFPGCSDIPSAENGQTCTMLIECGTILQNIEMLDPDKLSVLPSDGIILKKTSVSFNDGETVFDILCRETRNRQIHMESSYTPVFNSAYIEGINNLYEFDCGEGSGWVYSVNGAAAIIKFSPETALSGITPATTAKTSAPKLPADTAVRFFTDEKRLF